MNKKLFALMVCGAFLVTPLAANAAVDYFLTIDGVTGGSVDAKHKNAIDVLSFNWGLSVPVSTGGSGGGSVGKASFSDFSWTQGIDSSLPTLMVDAASGKTHKTAVFELVQPGVRPFTFLSMTFSNAILTSLFLSGASGDTPTASASFAYSKVEMDVTTQLADGSAGTTYKGIWDLALSKAGESIFSGSPVVFLQLADMSAPVSDSLVSSVPEPETYALMLSGLGLVGWMGRRNKQA